MQAVLLFVTETWVLLTEMAKNMEGVHVGFFRKVTSKTARRHWDGTWSRASAESVLKEAGTQNLGTYIDKRQNKAI